MTPSDSKTLRSSPKQLVEHTKLIQILEHSGLEANGADLKKTIAKSWHGWGREPLNDKPLVCMGGVDRPSLVAEYQGSGTCNYAQAQKLISLAHGQYHQSCQIPWEEVRARVNKLSENGGPAISQEDGEFLRDFSMRSNQGVQVDMFTRVKLHPLADRDIQFPQSPDYKFHPTTCGDAQWSIPVILDNFGMLDPAKTHPFLNILFHLNADQLHDFRSTPSFKKVAEAMEPALKKSKTRELKVAYPASSSHLAPLMVAFHLMDRDTLIRAELNFSEIDTRTPDRIGAYLELMEKMKVTLPGHRWPSSLITGLNKQVKKDDKGDWAQTRFTFGYRGKLIIVNVFNNPEPNKYIPDQYLKKSNLLVVHDLENSTEGERLLTAMGQYHAQGERKSPAWAVSDDQPKTPVQNATTQQMSGKFGCGPVDHTRILLGAQHWFQYPKGPDASLMSGARQTFDPFYAHSSFSLIKIHYDQNDSPFYLIGWN